MKKTRVFLLSEIWQIMKNIGFGFGGFAYLKEDAPQRVKYTAWGSFNSPSAPYIYCTSEAVIIGYKKVWKKNNKGESYFNQKNKREFINLVSGIWKYHADTKSQTIATFSLDIPLKALKILTYKNDIVLDPFMGSGTTALACKKLHRNFLGFEISRKYYEIANRRISQNFFDF